jgi:hypothetical protein
MPNNKPMHENETLTRQLRCVECGRSWLDPRERWRVYLTDDEPADSAAFCPGCSAREFDSD